MVEQLPRSAARSRCAASRSWIEAAVTTTASSRPFTSTAMCRLTPFVLLPPSQPRLDRGTVSAAGPVCESMIAAVGHRSRPARTRRRSRSASRMRCHAPLRAQRAKTAYTVPAGGNSTGSGRHAIPPRTMYRMASTITRRQCFSGRPPRPAVLPGAGNSGSRTAHSASVTDDEYTAHHVRPPRGAGTTGMARSAMMALWAPGLGGDLVITDPTRNRLLRFSARHTPAHRRSQTLSQGDAGLAPRSRGPSPNPTGKADLRWVDTALEVMVEHTDLSRPSETMVIRRTNARVIAR